MLLLFSAALFFFPSSFGSVLFKPSLHFLFVQPVNSSCLFYAHTYVLFCFCGLAHPNSRMSPEIKGWHLAPLMSMYETIWVGLALFFKKNLVQMLRNVPVKI